MNIIVGISLRNLIRQKRRTILLGIAIAFGTLILVVANSFSRGITDTLFNRIVVYVSGHVSINFYERGNYLRQVFHDSSLVMNIVNRTIADYNSCQEAIGAFCRVIGNGRADNVILVGMDFGAKISKKEVEDALQNFKMVQGEFTDLVDSSVENPVLITEEKAAYLNVKMGDILRLRFTNVLGQDQAARLTIVGIFRPANIFMGSVMFAENRHVKPLMGFRRNDIANLQINIKNAKRDAARLADSLHKQFLPPLACFDAAEGGGETVKIFGMRTDSASLTILARGLTLIEGDSAQNFTRKGVIISDSLAKKLHMKIGDTLCVTYKCRFDSAFAPFSAAITGIASLLPAMGACALVNEADFFDAFYTMPPVSAANGDSSWKKDTMLLRALSTEWMLLKRTRSTTDMQTMFREASRMRTHSVVVEIRSMYEAASAVLKLEAALQMITVAAVLILFFIILIGVVNTLRMTIRERTREIGTVRAIGMQKRDVRRAFVLETFFLAFFSSCAGTALAFLVMSLLSIPRFDAGENPLGMLLVNGHLRFVPAASAVAGFIVLICTIASVTAWFPARRASRLSAAAALRHYE